MVSKTRIELEIPQGVNVKLDNVTVAVSGPLGKLSRNIYYPGIEVAIEANRVVVHTAGTRRKVRSITTTISSHIQNMFTGVNTGFTCKMKVLYSHFPIQVKVDGGRVIVENFLGERKPRSARIVGEETKVEVSKEQITIKGIDKEAVGQTMANIEQATRIRNFDPRVFQDGIYPVSGGVR